MSKTRKDGGTKSFQALVLAENLHHMDDFFCLKPCPIECSLEKVLQQLERYGYQEIFIFCSSHHQEIKDFLSNRRQKSKNIKLVFDPESNTFAAILRTIYTRKIMSEDFVMIYGHLISDINLDILKQKYIEISENQKGLLMMEVFQTDKNIHDETSLVVWDTQTSLMNYYEKDLTSNFIFEDNYRYQFKQWFKEDFKSNIQFNFNAELAGISFCSKNLSGIIHTMNEFLMSKQNFIKEVLTSQISTELMALQFINKTDFHHKISRPQDFYQTSLFIIKSCFNYFYFNSFKYNISDMNKYIAKNATVSIHSQIGDNTFIGEQVCINQNSTIKGSIICNGVQIGQKCLINNSYIISDCVIEDECELINCYVMQTTPITKGTKLKDMYFNKNKWMEVETQVIANQQVWDENSYVLESDEEEEVESEKNTEELEELLERYIQHPEALREVITEIKSFWLGEGIEQEKRFEYIYKIILNKYIDTSVEGFLKSLDKLSQLAPLLNCFIDQDSDFEKEIILNCSEQYCRMNENTKIHLILQKLYQIELLPDDILIKWGHKKKESDNEWDTKQYKLMEKFLEWLEEEDESDEEEESDDD